MQRCRGWHVASPVGSPPTLPTAAPDVRPPGAGVTEASALTSPIALILGAGSVAELVLPWALIGLSDLFLFDTPAWSVWAVFASPLVITLVAVLTRLVIARRVRDH